MARNKKYSRCPSAPPADSRTMRYMRQGRAKSREKNSRRSQFLFFSRQNFLCVFPPYSIQLTPYYKRLPLHYSLFFTAPTVSRRAEKESPHAHSQVRASFARRAPIPSPIRRAAACRS